VRAAGAERKKQGQCVSFVRADDNRCVSTVDSEGRFTACEAKPDMKIRWKPDRKMLDKLG